MFEAYWREFVDAKIAEQYYLNYIHHSKRWRDRINAFCLIMSITGVATWIGDALHPVVASTIIIVSQVISILQPFYPYSDRLYAANCIYKEIGPIALSAEQNVNEYLYGSLTEEKLVPRLKQLQASMVAVNGKYANADLFPQKKRLHKKAEKNVSQYLQVHFDLGGWKA